MTSRNNQTPHLPAYLFIMFWLAQAISLFGDRLNNFSLLALINEFSPDPALTLSKIYLFMFLPGVLVAFAAAPRSATTCCSRRPSSS